MSVTLSTVGIILRQVSSLINWHEVTLRKILKKVVCWDRNGKKYL